MISISEYNQIRLNLESYFLGLPYVHAVLVRALISRANPQTGIVSNISYQEIATILTVKKAPGRKESGVPSKQSIRNYINTIEKEYSEHFRVVSVGQKLQFEFPHYPQIISKILQKGDINPHDNTEMNFKNDDESTEEKHVFINQVNTELNTQVNIPKTSVKKLFINNKINNNNTDGARGENKTILRTISQDFYPSPEIIARAIAAGHHHVTDAEMIQEFIDKNTAWGSTFADFNPIYLSFLAKHAERTQYKSVPFNTHTRSKDSERTSSKINSYDAALEEVRRYNQNACDPSEDELFPTPKALGIEHTTHLVALDGISQDIRPVVSY